MQEKKEFCPLCRSEAKLFNQSRGREYYRCSGCLGIFMGPSFLLTPEEERARYETHNNDVNDEGYRNFVRPLLEAVVQYFPKDAFGLDFGAGSGPVLSIMLQESGYEMALYDPYFHPNKDVLRSKYDFIVSCEVIEHFQDPEREFELLRQLLNPGGKFFCKTDPFSDDIDFTNWYYKNDPTHVFFYTDKSLEFIKAKFGFASLSRNGRLIEFSTD